MLTFAFPLALGLGVAVLLVGLFYFLRMRFRRQNVSSTFLWKQLAQVNDGGARLHWRSLLLLLLQVLAVVLLVLALAGLQAVLQKPVQPGTLYVLDTSASMGAREPGQELTRFARAVQALLADRATLNSTDRVAVFTGEGRPLVVVGGDLAGALRGWEPGSGELAEGPLADVLGAWLQTQGGTWTGVLVSDGGLDQGGTKLAPLFDGGWRTLEFAADAPNIGLTDLRFLAKGGVRLAVFNGFPGSQTLRFALTHEGNPAGEVTRTVPPGTSLVEWTQDTPNLGPGLWQVTLVEHQDALTADDRFTLAVETPRTARVLHLGSPDPYLKAAFPGARFVEREGTSTDGGPWDLVVTDNQLPAPWSGPLITFGALPAGAPVFWGEPISGRLSGQTATHPLSRWVPWAETAVTTGRALLVQPGATVLAEAGGWPIVVSWEQNGSPHLALGVGTRGSNLGLTPVLPILVQNFRQAVLPQESNPLAANLRVGRSSMRAGSASWHVTSSTAPSGASALGAVRRGGLWELLPREAGTFTWADGDETGVLAVQLPVPESDTAPRATVAAEPRSVAQAAGLQTQAIGLAPWLALLVLGFLALEWRLWNGRFDPRNNRSLAGLRLSAAAAVLLALTGLTLPWPTTERNLALVLDVSASLGPELVEQERQAALKLVASLAANDRAAVIAFAGTPKILAGLQLRDQALATLQRVPLNLSSGTEATDVSAALAAGAQLLAGQPGSSSQVLLSDGRATRGGGLEALSIQARRFPVSAVPLGRALGGVTGLGLEVPDTARPSEQVVVRWRGASDQARTVTASLKVDGTLSASKQADLVVGENTVEFVLNAGGAGTRNLEVVITAGDDTDLPSARAAGLLSVEGRAPILVIRGPQTSGALAPALERQGLPVVVRPPSGLPDTQAGYQDLSAVVLDNVSAPSLSLEQQARLGDWVASGGGLLVVGGTSSLGRGEYFSSELEKLLPVQTDNRQRLQFTRSRILFVVDHSGSMSEEVGRTTKLEAAVGGVAQSLAQLTSQDEVGFLQFDSEANWVLPFTPLSRKAEVLEALKGFSQGGGTDLTKALDEVVTAFGHPGPVKRHVILMTDGQTGGEDQFFHDFSETMKAAQVSMTVIGIGTEVNDKLLGDLAQASDGVYYRARGDDIPSILHNETVRVTREQVQEGRFPVKSLGSDAVVDLGGEPPPVRGYLVTKAKPLARVRWEVTRSDGSSDPLYADWRYGAGRVAVFASDSGLRWLSLWSGLPEYNRFWAQAVRSLETGSRDKTLGLEVHVSASMAHLVVEAIDETGRLRSGAALTADQEGRTYPLTETAPGRYEAQIPLQGEGLQLVSVADRAGPGRTWAWAWNPRGTELSQGGADWAGLGRFAASTGGQLQPLINPQPPATVWAWAPLPLRDVFLGLALLLFVLELGLRSTSLGQLTSARAVLKAWWTDQSRPWVKPLATPVVRDEAEVERRTREAYKYLAQKKRPGA